MSDNLQYLVIEIAAVLHVPFNEDGAAVLAGQTIEEVEEAIAAEIEEAINYESGYRIVVSIAADVVTHRDKFKGVTE